MSVSCTNFKPMTASADLQSCKRHLQSTILAVTDVTFTSLERRLTLATTDQVWRGWRSAGHV
jgi:hypothetical protein